MVFYTDHDYGIDGREIAGETTAGEEKASNIHVGNNISNEKSVMLREERDANLAVPNLTIPSLPVNMRDGNMPIDEHGNPTLKVPLNGLKNVALELINNIL